MSARSIAQFLVHEVQHERHLGGGAHGPSYGPPRTLRALVDMTQRVIRDANGEQRAVSSQVYLEPDAGVEVEDRITWRGRPGRVAAVAVRDGGGLPTPDHVQVSVE